MALADLNRVSQIIRILIDNAITHTPQGTNVTVTAVRGRNAVELIVGDDAKKGIDPRAIEKVFDRFYTGDAATGSGLGLAIADELALRMDGQLAVVSRRGHTAFTLSLPVSGRRRRQREPAGVPREEAVFSAGSRPGGGGDRGRLRRWRGHDDHRGERGQQHPAGRGLVASSGGTSIRPRSTRMSRPGW